MKSGTTTLYRDLSRHPNIFLPEEKEPDTLVKWGNADRLIRDDYRSLLAGAKEGQLCGEASTAYTKRPDLEGVAPRALRICGPSLRIVYLMRDPIARAVSHYKHDVGLGRQKKPFEEAVRTDARYIDYSRYEWQLEPWIETFGEEGLLRVQFEDYVKNRASTVRSVCAFLGVDARLLPRIREDRVFNASDAKPVALTPLWRRVLSSKLYQRRLKPLVPQEIRSCAYRLLLPKAANVYVDLNESLRDYLQSELAKRR